MDREVYWHTSVFAYSRALLICSWLEGFLPLRLVCGMHQILCCVFTQFGPGQYFYTFLCLLRKHFSFLPFKLKGVACYYFSSVTDLILWGAEQFHPILRAAGVEGSLYAQTHLGYSRIGPLWPSTLCRLLLVSFCTQISNLFLFSLLWHISFWFCFYP